MKLRKFIAENIKKCLDENSQINNYIYHGTGKGQALNIQKDGYMKLNKTGEEQPSISFTNDLDYAKYYAKSKGGLSKMCILRTKLDDAFKLSPRIRNNKGDEYITFKNVLSSDLEIMTVNGSWQPLDSWNVVFDEPLIQENNDLEKYTIDDDFYLYKDGVRQFSSTSKKDLIQYLQNNKPELLDKFNLSPAKKNEHSGAIMLYRGHGYNEGNNFYSPSKEFALEFTRTGRESELTKVKVNVNKIYKHEPLPRGYGREDENFDKAIEVAKSKGLNAIWVDEGFNQPNSVFKIDVNKSF